MIKVIFFDLDGTLLDSNKKISITTFNALRQCREQGIKLYIATARPPLIQKMLSLTNEEMGLFDGGIYYNGGYIQINKRNENRKEYKNEYRYLSETVVKYCIKQVENYEKLNIALQLKNEMHAFRFPLVESAYDKWGIERNKSLELKQANKCEVVKILIHYENIIDSITTLPDDLVNELNKHCSEEAKMYLTDNKKVLQLINPNINKKESIEQIRKTLSLQKEEVAVFGDDINDIEMLSAFDNSIAMGNAEENVKQAARMITKDNNHDGIEYALKNILKII